VKLGIKRRIDRIAKALTRLEKITSLPLEKIIEDELESMLEREVEIVIQGLLDIGEYIISCKGFEVPSSYRDIGIILWKNRVLDRESGEKLSRLAGLRNILVHIYSDIDYELLYNYARKLVDDARSMLQIFIDYMEKQGIDP